MAKIRVTSDSVLFAFASPPTQPEAERTAKTGFPCPSGDHASAVFNLCPRFHCFEIPVRLSFGFFGFILGVNVMPTEALNGLVEAQGVRSRHLVLQTRKWQAQVRSHMHGCDALTQIFEVGAHRLEIASWHRDSVQFERTDQ